MVSHRGDNTKSVFSRDLLRVANNASVKLHQVHWNENDAETIEVDKP